jgi:hypothetical protein
MIPEIGLMIGFCIITIMLSYVLRSGEKKEHSVVVIFAAITIFITILIIIDLFMRGVEIDKMLTGISY